MPGPPHPEASYVLADGVVYEVLDGEAVLLHLPTGTYYRLNEVATRAWTSLVATGRLDEGRATILAEFDTTEPVLDADLEDLLADMLSRGLIREGTSGRAAPEPRDPP